MEGYIEITDGVGLFYRLAGCRRGYARRAARRAGLHFEYLAPDLDALAESHTLIFYDQRGAGRSTLITEISHDDQ